MLGSVDAAGAVFKEKVRRLGRESASTGSEDDLVLIRQRRHRLTCGLRFGPGLQ